MAGRDGINVTVRGMGELRRSLADMQAAIRAGAAKAVAAETEAVADDMRRGAPRDSGELVDSIQAEHDGLSGTAAATARHAAHVEHGTSDTPAQPFAQPAAEQARRRFPRRLADAIGDELADGVVRRR